MNVRFHKNFIKSYRKLSAKLQSQTDERLVLFRNDPYDLVLNNHLLKGKYQGNRSINITGDFRAIFKLLDADLAYFVEIGTHDKLYK